MTGILALTDGTTRINLFTGIDGFTLQNWTPTIPPSVGVWRESPLTDGRKLAMTKWANATEKMTFVVSRFTQNDVISDIQDLRRLLLAAREYFTGVSTTPVWIEARGACETNTRYAVVCDWDARNDADPYSKPFAFSKSGVDGFVLSLERQHWRHLPPGQSECVELSATQAYLKEQHAAYVPTQSEDDCTVNFTAANISLIGSLYFGNNIGSSRGAGIRFRSVAIPVGAIVTHAFVRVYSGAAEAADNCNVKIDGEQVAASAQFSTYANYTGRARTAASAAWNIVPHFAGGGASYDTPDIATVVQEIVSLGGWASGNPVTIFIDNNASTANAYRTCYSWDDAGHEPELYVWWFDTTTGTFGRTATCANEVYVANKHNMAQLTHIYHFDNSTGLYSGNLIGAALPVALLPAAPAVNDAVYFGIDTALANSGPFCSLVFDILAAQVDITTLTWQYYDSIAAAWHALTVRDNTNANGAGTGVAFDTTGVNSVHWEQPNGAIHNWGTTTVNGITGYWVRALVGAVGAGPTPPTQQTRDIYTVVTPFVDALATETIGDIQALAKQYIEGQSGNNTNKLIEWRVYAGLRSYSRGANFTPYLNLADTQNQAGITVTVNGAGGVAFATDTASPTGRVAQWTTGGAAAETWLAYVTIGSTLVSQYNGQFRCFVRYYQTVGGGAKLRLLIANTAYTLATSRTNQVATSNGNPFYADFGKITLPNIPFEAGNTYDNTIIRIDGQTTGATTTNLLDVILMPADECLLDSTYIPIVDTGAAPSETALQYGSYGWLRLDADSTIPRKMILTETQNAATGDTVSPWRANIAGPLVWQPNEHQRWWYFFQGDNAAPPEANPELVASVQGWQVSRYLSMRGAR